MHYYLHFIDRGAGLSRREWKSKSERNRVLDENRGVRGQQLKLMIEAKRIGHVGLVGYTNAGKSTLLKALTNMNVKIAGTTMTTLRPNIGTVPGKDRDEFGFKIADLPGLIDGAHAGKGIGDHFLSMIERNRRGVQNSILSTGHNSFSNLHKGHI